jgi:DNA-binding response OmpR family regulator
MAQILLVEDDHEICEILQFYLLQKPSYSVTVAHSAEEALALMPLRNFDLILLDILLPDENGLDLCEKLRQTTFCPIIFISCLSDDETVIRALTMGGDDYLIKPFQAPVLLARIEANLRRYSVSRTDNGASPLRAGDLTLDPARHTVARNSVPLALSPTEYELLAFFMRNPGRFIRFDELYEAVWQRPSMGDLRTLFVHIAHLRQKIEPDPSQPIYIRTHMRDGYIFSADAT